MILCDYRCPSCEVFEAVVESPAPDEIPCPACGATCTWVPSAVMGRAKRWEVQRGKWQKPERETYLDTRELGEGMPLDEFQEKRRKVWDQKRKEDVMRLVRGE